MLVDVFTSALVQHNLENGSVCVAGVQLPSGQQALVTITTGVDAVRGFLALIETMARVSGASGSIQFVNAGSKPS